MSKVAEVVGWTILLTGGGWLILEIESFILDRLCRILKVHWEICQFMWDRRKKK